MSGSKCKQCGSTNIETDPARGDAVCTECGFVLEDQLIVSETAFEEAPSGNMIMCGQFVSNESSGGAQGFGAGYMQSSKESREITIQNAKKGITHLCRQLQLNQHCIDTSVNFYKMALSRHLTRGRKQAQSHAACVYITCRTEGTAHMLIDISDILQICVHELGKTYLKFTQALCINIPSMDPCLYIIRFANKLEFGEKTHEVSMTALRVLQRMKKDSIHSGRRPSGLCGAALLMAARLHDFNRTPSDIVKIVKVHETTLRKRLVEFGDTPSSALTLDDFMQVDLEEEQDPPAFKAARKKDRERLQKVENITTEVTDLQTEIDKQLEEQKNNKSRHSKNSVNLEDTEADRFVRESNLNVIEKFVGRRGSTESSRQSSQPDSTLSTGLGPDISIMGLNPMSNKNKIKDSSYVFEDIAGEVDLTDLDDEELDSYIMSEKESQFKSNLWNKVNEKYLKEQKEKEEKRQKEKEEGKPEKKRRKAKKKCQPANTPGEAIEKMLQEKRISSKINYEVLKSLTIEPPSTPKPIPDDIAFAVPQNVTKKDGASTPTPAPKSPVRVLPEPVKSSPYAKVNLPLKRKISFSETESVPEVIASIDSDAADEADDYLDDEVDIDPSEEMSVAQMLRRQAEDNDEYGFDYDDDY